MILILVMTVALAIGISVIQRSLSDISTSSKVEQSSRAFSAAEAGIEKALRNDFTGASFTDSSAQVTGSGLLPLAGQALEYPPLGKEEVAQVWLADPDTLAKYFDQAILRIAWGSLNLPDAEKPAIEVTMVYLSGGAYVSQKRYLDPVTSRTANNRFDDVSSSCSNSLATFNTTSGTNRQFYCQYSLTLPVWLTLLRARILYSNTSQPFAVRPGTCGETYCQLPPQARIIESTGTAGETQRKVQLFQLYKVVPPYFDYGIFSVGEINKN